MKTGSLLITFLIIAYPCLPVFSTLEEGSFEAIKSQCKTNCVAYGRVSAKIRINTEMISGEVNVTTEANGTYEHQRKGTKLQFRVEMTNKITTKNRGRTIDDEQNVLTICDGSNAYTLTQQKGKPATAVKAMPMSSQTLLADEPFFQVLANSYSLRVMPDEKIDGQDVWVIEAKPKAPRPGQAAKTLHYIRKDAAIRVRSTGHDSTGRRIQFTGLTEVKLDPEIDPRRFIFEAPEGVKIVDMTARPK